MNYDLDTAEGMANSVAWMEDVLSSGQAPILIWFVPRSGATYTIDKVSKVYHRDVVDSAIDRVLDHMDFKKGTLQ
jgi:hypothetical protein